MMKIEGTFEDINKKNQEIIKKDFPSIFGKHFIHDADIGPVFPVYSDGCVIKNLIDKQILKKEIMLLPNDPHRYKLLKRLNL